MWSVAFGSSTMEWYERMTAAGGKRRAAVRRIELRSRAFLSKRLEFDLIEIGSGPANLPDPTWPQPYDSICFAEFCPRNQ